MQFNKGVNFRKKNISFRLQVLMPCLLVCSNRFEPGIMFLSSRQQFKPLFQTDTFAAVYKKLTGKEVTFEFPEPIL